MIDLQRIYTIHNFTIEEMAFNYVVSMVVVKKMILIPPPQQAPQIK